MSPLVLYGTAGCHLCAAAEALLQRFGVPASHIDIIADEVLLETYGTRIPVLRRTDTDAELGWPFDREAVERFVA